MTQHETYKKIAKDYGRLQKRWKTTGDYQRLQHTIKDYRRVQKTMKDCKRIVKADISDNNYRNERWQVVVKLHFFSPKHFSEHMNFESFSV